MKVRPHITHQSHDIGKDRTKSILKQASHLITETGEAADYQVAHLEDIYNSDPDQGARAKKSRYGTRPVSSGLRGTLPMTAFMDYKDYRIDYERRGDSSFGSSKDYSAVSNSYSVYERTKINKEIRAQDREKARRTGTRSQLVNSDDPAKEGKNAKAIDDGDSSPPPSAVPYQMRRGRKSNIKIRSYLAAAREPLNYGSREYSQHIVGSDYCGGPVASGRPQLQSTDKAGQQYVNKNQEGYRS